MAGGLIKEEELSGGTSYAGGVDIAVEPWAFPPGGGYGKLNEPAT
jgi:hypothetical protein